LAAASPTLPLNKGSIVTWRLVLDDRPYVRIVEADLERTRGDDDLRVRIYASILAARSSDS
jgi:hypothetical protein